MMKRLIPAAALFAAIALPQIALAQPRPPVLQPPSPLQMLIGGTIKAQDTLGAYGATVNLRATVQRTSPVPGDAVQFKVGAMVVGTAPVGADGTASIPFVCANTLPLGAQPIHAETVQHAGASVLQDNSTLTLIKRAVTLSMGYEKPAGTPMEGMTVHLKGKLVKQPNDGAVEGRQVKLTDSDKVIGNAATGADGSYDFSYKMPAGDHVWRAKFDGDTHYLPTESQTASLHAQPLPPPPVPKVTIWASDLLVTPTKPKMGMPFVVGLKICKVSQGDQCMMNGGDGGGTLSGIKFHLSFISADCAGGTSNGDGIAAVNCTPQMAGFEVWQTMKIVSDDPHYDIKPFTNWGLGIDKGAAIIKATGPATVHSGDDITVDVTLTTALGKPLRIGTVTKLHNTGCGYVQDGHMQCHVKVDNSFPIGSQQVKVGFTGDKNYLDASDTFPMKVLPNNN